jgi:PadR family transcriptional regulator AphA
MTDATLTGTSYVVLGMLDWLGPSTPYRLKRVLTDSVEDFFPVPHTSFYAEPARLAGMGLLSAEQEPGGRRRKTYALTEAGRAALRAWLDDPATAYGQFRFPGMLKLFFGADPAAFALDQAEHHAALHAKFAAVRAQADAGELEIAPNRRLVLETGISLHAWWARRWREVAEQARGLD